MPICAVCGHDNPFGALSCAKCYTMLAPIDPERQSTTISPDTIVRSPEEMPLATRRLSRYTGMLGVASVAMFINDHEEPMILDISNQAVLGRYTPNSTTQPRVDLTPYGAFERGVSRMHLVIRRGESGLSVEDLGSSNGSWLNSTRLQPYVPAPLKSGDRLRLSQIEIEVYFGKPEKDQPEVAGSAT
jgi:hypothetical protein